MVIIHLTVYKNNITIVYTTGHQNFKLAWKSLHFPMWLMLWKGCILLY